MIIPSEKVAQRLAEIANVKAQGEAAIAAMKASADAHVLFNGEEIESSVEEKDEMEMEGED